MKNNIPKSLRIWLEDKIQSIAMNMSAWNRERTVLSPGRTLVSQAVWPVRLGEHQVT